MAKQMASAANEPTWTQTDPDYGAFLPAIERGFRDTTEGAAPLFETDAEGLFDLYLASLPVEMRQEHQCRACRKFVERFGGLVTIGDDGSTIPAMWGADGFTGPYKVAAAALSKRIAKATVMGVFLSSMPVWGEPVTGKWRHMAVKPTLKMQNLSPLTTAGQAMAEKLEERRMLIAGLDEFPLTAFEQACKLLASEQLYRGGKFEQLATWLLECKRTRQTTRNKRVAGNLLWRAVAKAPAGWCHVRSGMIGTLLEDIESGLPFGDIARKFRDKMNPLQYQRPSSLPAAGNVKQAEEIVAKLGATGAFRRRYARVDDIQAFVWRKPESAPQTASAMGLFGSTPRKGSEPERVADIRTPTVTVTWEKFKRAVLPTAKRVEYRVPSVVPGYALVTACDMDSAPILQWDDAEKRNPVSWFTVNGAHSASEWNLTGGTYRDVLGVCHLPPHWADEDGFAHQTPGALFVVDGCRFANPTSIGCGIFPEHLRSEFHAVRATVESYSRSNRLEGETEASACGPCVRKGSAQMFGQVFRVTGPAGAVEYMIDRWD